jgi:hypothetical protein
LRVAQNLVGNTWIDWKAAVTEERPSLFLRRIIRQSKQHGIHSLQGLEQQHKANPNIGKGIFLEVALVTAVFTKSYTFKPRHDLKDEFIFFFSPSEYNICKIRCMQRSPIYIPVEQDVPYEITPLQHDSPAQQGKDVQPHDPDAQ